MENLSLPGSFAPREAPREAADMDLPRIPGSSLDPVLESRARDVLGLGTPGTVPDALPPRVEQLWRLDGFAANVPLVNTMFIPMGPALDLALLREAVAMTVARHQALRTRLTVKGGRAGQLVESAPPAAIACVDIRKGDIAENRPGGRASAVSEFTQMPFDLLSEAGFRCRAFRDEAGSVTLCVTAHGFFSDAWSSQVLRREILAHYSALKTGERAELAPAGQYADYARAQRHDLDKGLASHLNYWHGRLHGAPPSLLPRDHQRQAGRRGRSFFRIGAEDVARLSAIAQTSRLSLTMVLLAAFQLALARWSGQTDILSAAYTADRLDPKFQNTIGLLVASLPVRSRIDPVMDLRTFLSELARDFFGGYAHRQLSCELYEAIYSPPGPFCAPVFNFVPLQKNYLTGDAISVPDFEGIASAPEVSRPAIFREIYLGLIQHPGGILGKLYFNADFFAAAGVAVFIRHFQQVIATAGPDARLKTLLGPL